MFPFLPAIDENSVPDTSDQQFQAILGTETFLDKTYMIRNIVVGPQCLYITAPPRSGKTTNLHMLKMFFEIPLDESGQNDLRESDPNSSLFVKYKLDITRYPEWEKDFATYLVVYVDCKCNRDLRDHSDMTTFCLEVIHKAYKQHEYLRYCTQLPHKDEVHLWYHRYEWKRKKANFVGRGLGLLVQSLKFHYSDTANVMVLVDDIDAPLMSLIRNQRLQEVSIYDKCKNLYHSMWKQLTTCRENIRLIFTGVFRIETPLPGYDYHTYEYLSDEKYTSFYGATSTDVKKLLDGFNISPGFRRHVRDAYGGYRSIHGTDAMYDIHGVISFLKQSKETRVFHFDFPIVNVDVNLTHVLHDLRTHEKIWELLSNCSLSSSSHLSVDSADTFIEKLHNSQYNQTSQINMDSFSFLLLQLGCISYAWPEPPWLPENICCAKCKKNSFSDRYTERPRPYTLPGPCQLYVPNMGAYNRLKRCLFGFYWRTFSFSEDSILKCGRRLTAFSQNGAYDAFLGFTVALGQLFQTNYFSQENASAYLAFYPVVCSVSGTFNVDREFDWTEFRLFAKDLEVRICIIMGHENASDALKEACARKNLQRGDGLLAKKRLYIGINVLPKWMEGVKVDVQYISANY